MSVALRLPKLPPRSRHISEIRPICTPGSFRRDLDSYSMIATLAVGDTATVYVARDVVLERAVVVKVLHPWLVGTRAAVALLDEARLLATLSHPSIVAVHELGEDLPYFVMERARGTDLVDARLCAAEVATVGAQLASALAYLHERGLVHGKLDAANVVVGEGRAKLVDFGAAHRGDTADDVQALGVLLASVLEGHAPAALRHLLRACVAAPAQRPSAARIAVELERVARAA